jgi:preprotein translocase subunit SecG
MVTLITILHVLLCVFLILVVLLQAGKGGGMGLAFGSSGAQTVFGGSGAGNFLTRVTAGIAAAFMLTSLTLAYIASARQTSWIDEYEQQMAAQQQRDREARERLVAPGTLDGGVAPAEEQEPVDVEGATSTETESEPGVTPAAEPGEVQPVAPGAPTEPAAPPGAPPQPLPSPLPLDPAATPPPAPQQ